MDDTGQSTGGPLRTILEGAFVVLLGNLVGVAATFGVRVIIARYRGPTEYGLIVLGITILNVASLVGLLGLPQGIARELPRSTPEERGELVKIAFLGSLPVATIISVLLLVFNSTVEEVLGEPRLGPIVAVFSLTVPLFVAFKILVAGFRGLEDAISRTILHNFLYQGGTTLFVGIGIVLGLHVVNIAAAWPLSLAIAVGVGAYYLFSDSGIRLSASRVFGTPLARSLIAFSLPLMVSNGAWLLLQYADNFLLGYFRSASVVGVYDAAFTLGRSILLFTWAMAFLFVPVFSKIHAEGQRDEMDRIYKSSTRILTFVVLPLVLLLAHHRNYVLSSIFGQEFVAGGTAFLVLLLGFFSHVLLGVNRGALTAIGLPTLVLRGNIVALGLNLLLNVALIPPFGVTGAAMASAASYLCANIYWTGVLFRKQRVQPFDRPYLVATLLSISLFALISVFGGVFVHKTPIGIGILTMGYLLGHLATIIVFGDVTQGIGSLIQDRLA